MEKRKKRSAFGPPRPNEQLIRASPPLLHVTAYHTGGLKQLYSNIIDEKHDWTQEYGQYTDERGELDPHPDMPLLAGRYKYVEILGKGQSSVLIKALDTYVSGEAVSVKVLHTHYHVLGTQEMDCIRKLNMADPEGFSPTIRLQNTFAYDGHFCMVFELLDPRSLLSHFSKISHERQKLQCLRKVTVCLLQALGFLQQQNVIHADLKPENILMVDGLDFRRLKVVDLGNAIHCIHEELSLYYDDFELQTLLYRAPEVIYGVPFGLEVDMWSLGCILAELYLGEPLFHSNGQRGILGQMVEILGPIPQSFQRGKFFTSFKSFAGPTSNQDVTLMLMKKLGTNDYSFADFLKGLLQYDPVNRLTVREAAEHSFLAPELAIKFLTSQPDRTPGYQSVVLTKEVYSYSPNISDDVKKSGMSSLELLHHGTGVNNQGTGVNNHGTGVTNLPGKAQNTPKKVAQIVPMMRVVNPESNQLGSSARRNEVRGSNLHSAPPVESVNVRTAITMEESAPLFTQTATTTMYHSSNITAMQQQPRIHQQGNDVTRLPGHGVMTSSTSSSAVHTHSDPLSSQQAAQVIYQASQLRSHSIALMASTLEDATLESIREPASSYSAELPERRIPQFKMRSSSLEHPTTSDSSPIHDHRIPHVNTKSYAHPTRSHSLPIHDHRIPQVSTRSSSAHPTSSRSAELPECHIPQVNRSSSSEYPIQDHHIPPVDRSSSTEHPTTSHSAELPERHFPQFNKRASSTPNSPQVHPTTSHSSALPEQRNPQFNRSSPEHPITSHSSELPEQHNPQFNRSSPEHPITSHSSALAEQRNPQFSRSSLEQHNPQFNRSSPEHHTKLKDKSHSNPDISTDISNSSDELYVLATCSSSSEPSEAGHSSNYSWKKKLNSKYEHQPRAAKILAMKHQVAKPHGVKPEAATPQTAKPQAAKPQAAKPLAAKPQAAKPLAAKPLAEKPQSAKPLAAKPLAAKPQSGKTPIQNNSPTEVQTKDHRISGASQSHSQKLSTSGNTLSSQENHIRDLVMSAEVKDIDSTCYSLLSNSSCDKNSEKRGSMVCENVKQLGHVKQSGHVKQPGHVKKSGHAKQPGQVKVKQQTLRAKCETDNMKCETGQVKDKMVKVKGEMREAKGEMREAKGEMREAKGDMRKAKGETVTVKDTSTVMKVQNQDMKGILQSKPNADDTVCMTLPEHEGGIVPSYEQLHIHRPGPSIPHEYELDTEEDSSELPLVFQLAGERLPKTPNPQDAIGAKDHCTGREPHTLMEVKSENEGSKKCVGSCGTFSGKEMDRMPQRSKLESARKDICTDSLGNNVDLSCAYKSVSHRSSLQSVKCVPATKPEHLLNANSKSVTLRKMLKSNHKSVAHKKSYSRSSAQFPSSQCASISTFDQISKSLSDQKSLKLESCETSANLTSKNMSGPISTLGCMSSKSVSSEVKSKSNHIPRTVLPKKSSVNQNIVKAEASSSHNGDSSPEYTVNVLHDLLSIAPSPAEVEFSSDEEMGFNVHLPRAAYATPAKPPQSNFDVANHAGPVIHMKNVRIEKSRPAKSRQSAGLQDPVRSKQSVVIHDPEMSRKLDVLQDQVGKDGASVDTSENSKSQDAMLKEIGMYCEIAVTAPVESKVSEESIIKQKRKTPSKNRISVKRKKVMELPLNSKNCKVDSNSDSGCSVVVSTPDCKNMKNKKGSQTKQLGRSVKSSSSSHQSPGGVVSDDPADGYESGSCSRPKVKAIRKVKRHRHKIKNVARQVAASDKQHESRVQTVPTISRQKVIHHTYPMDDTEDLVDDVLLL